MVDAGKMARQRVSELLSLAAKTWRGDKKLAGRYVQLARRIAMRHRIKLGNRLFCKKCGTIFVPGETLRVRKARGALVYVCSECGAARKFPLRPRPPR